MTEHELVLDQGDWSFKHLRGRASALFSACRSYRYRLERRWDDAKPVLVIAGLNPSSAGIADDATIRKEVWFAHLWGCGAIVKVNLFAVIETASKKLPRMVGAADPTNDATIREAFVAARERGRLLLAWGKGGELNYRGHVLGRLAQELHGAPECFGVCLNGQPKHPLYLPYSLQPVPFTPIPGGP